VWMTGTLARSAAIGMTPGTVRRCVPGVGTGVTAIPTGVMTAIVKNGWTSNE
jgi:hypothetical protein